MAPKNLPAPRIISLTEQFGRVALSIAEFSTLTGLGRTRVFEELKSGRLQALKCGRRTLIPIPEIEAWIKALGARKVG